MWRWQTMTGIVLGLLAGGAVLSIIGGGGNEPVRLLPPAGPVLSECDGRLAELVIHYEPAARELVARVYQDFLGALPDDVRVHVVCPDRAAFDGLAAIVGPVNCRLSPVVVGHAITPWSRDRWVALAPAATGGPTTLLSPLRETADEIWPGRAGDERVGGDLAAALAPAVTAVRSNLCFDGGDLLADGDRVFVVPRVLQRNIQHTVGTQEELLQTLARQLGRRVVLLHEAPDHHAGMFMVAVGQGRMLVGDPHLGQLITAGTPLPDLPGGPDFTPATQQRFDAVAAQCAALGYQVTRLPVVPACDGRTYLTYANVLLDQRGQHRTVYLPCYDGVAALNAAARDVWAGLGYEVRPVDCSRVYRNFGCLHCLVNVLRRDPARPATAPPPVSPHVSPACRLPN